MYKFFNIKLLYTACQRLKHAAEKKVLCDEKKRKTPNIVSKYPHFLAV